MNNSRKKLPSLFLYRDSLLKVRAYQFLSKFLIFMVMQLFKWVTGILLWNLGRPAFTSGDLPYLMRSFEGWLIIILGFLVLVVYTIFDINITVLLCDSVLHRKKIKVTGIIKKSVSQIKHFKSFFGVAVIIYIAILAPLSGAAFGISLTENITIPEFIMSVINDHLYLKALYYIMIAVLFAVGIIYIFTFHFTILGDCDVLQSAKKSRKLLMANWKHFAWNYLLFIAKWFLLILAMTLVLFDLPAVLLRKYVEDDYLYHVGIIFVALATMLWLFILTTMIPFFNMLKLTLLYETYTGGEPSYEKGKTKGKIIMASLITVVLAVFAIVSAVLAMDFDAVFPAITEKKVVAHRGGGYLANENTVLSLEKAIDLGIQYSEIDVQRTLDGEYIINHDNTFKRCCDVDKKPSEMNLSEIKKLKVKNAFDPFGEDTQVATFSEILDAAEGRINLLIELKGETADEKMAKDVCEEVAKRGMTKQVMIIGLDCGLMEYIEEEYPEMETGYLCFFSFGEIEDIKCDALLLEGATATEDNIAKIHDAGKDAYVWTVNTISSMTSFMRSDIDGIITDDVKMASEVRRRLKNRTDEARVFDTFLPL